MFIKKDLGPNKVIVFYYKTEDLFNDISLLTMYRAKNILAADSKESQIDEVGVSQDELDAFKVFAKTSIFDAFAQVVKMTKGVPSSPWVDSEVSLDESSTSSSTITTDKSYGFMIFDNEAYNVNMVQLVDHGILQFMRAEILFNWWDMTGIDAEASKAKAKWDDARRSLVNKYLFQLRKPLMRS